MRKSLALASALVLLALLAGAALAHTQTVLDGDDSEGPLDIVAARHGHKAGNGKPSANFKLVTYETWTYQSIDDGRREFISFEINLDDDESIERCLVVRAHTPPEGTAALGYSATVHQDCVYFNDPVVKSYGVDHISFPDAHSVRVRVPKRVLLGAGVDNYRWRGVTSFEQYEHQNDPCYTPPAPSDGLYGICADFTSWKRHG